MKTVPVRQILLLIGCLTSFGSHGDEEQETPDLEFLEFLGSFTSADGKWVDPMEIEKTALLIEQPSDNIEEAEEEKHE